MRKSHLSAVCGLVLYGVLLAGTPVAATPWSAQAPDNTATNKDDRSKASADADTAKNNTSDRQLMARIRRDVIHEKSLSTYAHNVKIVAQGGKVTLKGPVKSDDEKHTIEQIATKHAGDGNVDDQLTIASSK
jgi:osmotically-inducible protein OsmY